MSAQVLPLVAVLISANVEWRAISSLFPESHESTPLGSFFWKQFSIDGRLEPVLFFHGGWGKIAAAASTQYVIDRWRPRLLINLGTCGGFEGEIERGTIVLAERTLVYDIVEQMGDADEHIAHYTTDLTMEWLTADPPQPVFQTLLVSGDRDLMVEDIPLLKTRYGAVAGDWESGAIAWVASKNGVDCLILRGVTDLVGSNGGEAYGNMDLFERNTSHIMQLLVEYLPAWISRYIQGWWCGDNETAANPDS